MLGHLLVLEGPDGCGKTSLARALVERLSTLGQRAVYASLPGNAEGSLGALVYSLNRSSEDHGVREIDPLARQLLHVAAHVDTIERMIKPSLCRGLTVVLDRWWWSTWVYGQAAGLALSTVEALTEFERRSWLPYRATATLLVQRASSLRAEERTPRWTELAERYRLLARTRATADAVHYVNNAFSPDKALTFVTHLVLSLGLSPH